MRTTVHPFLFGVKSNMGCTALHSLILITSTHMQKGAEHALSHVYVLYVCCTSVSLYTESSVCIVKDETTLCV